jgi:hypothetical protein
MQTNGKKDLPTLLEPPCVYLIRASVCVPYVQPPCVYLITASVCVPY